MSRNIAIFFHCLFRLGDPPQLLPQAFDIVGGQVDLMTSSGLVDAASEIVVGINDDDSILDYACQVLPVKAKIVLHGLTNRNENLTVESVIEFAKTHPGWNILYLHGKGASHDPDCDYARNVSTPWQKAMTLDLAGNWRQCVADLDAGHDIACSRWLWEMGWDKSQHIPAGNFLWLTSDFAAKLPSLHLRTRIKEDGIGALTSRYESEVAWGNGPRPNVKAYRPNGGGGIP